MPFTRSGERVSLRKRMLGRGSRSLRMWSVVAVAIIAIGTFGAVLVAGISARNQANNAREQFKKSSVEMTTTLALAIQHEQDLIISASGFIATNPGASNLEFGQWVATVQTLQRYPELLGPGHSIIVPAAGLAAFAVQALHDPAGPVPAGGFEVTPPGKRPFYCFATSKVSRTPSTAFPVEHDFCAATSGRVELNARDTGQTAYVAITVAGGTALSVLTPIYRAGIPPATVAGRRDAFLGFMGNSFLPNTLLAQASAGHPGIAVRVQFQLGSSTASFTSGVVPRHAQTATIVLPGGWNLQTFGPATNGELFDNWSAVSILIVGILATLLLAGMVFILATGRLRALRLVGEKTGELRHQARHDPLTDLPNRA